jgi:hypothetical protein
MNKHVGTILGMSALFVGSLIGPISAQTTPATTQTTQTTQTTDTTGPHNAYCGNYVNGTWTPNGNCMTETVTTTTSTTPTTSTGTSAMAAPNAPARMPERLTGTITSVKGHLVTLQQSTNSLVVDDSRALKREDTGKVAVGRAITAHGYWEAGTFYANRFETAGQQ